MQKELHDHYRGRKVFLSTQGYASSLHTRVMVNGLDVSSRLLASRTDGASTDLGLVIIKVRRMIDEDLL